MPPKPEPLPATLQAYRLLTAAATPLAGLLLAHRLRRGKEDAVRLAERRGEGSRPRPDGALIWLHGASVGELVAASPLIERLAAGGLNVLVTSGTVTSARIAAQRLPPGAIHQFAPLDAPAFIDRFLDHWRPDLALLIESDLWPNLIIGAASRGIPLVLANARMSERSFLRWHRLPGTIAALLHRIGLCLAQSPLHAERYARLGAAQVRMVGNLKLDVPAPPADPAELAALGALTGSRVLIAAASTHPGEEEAILDVHARLQRRFPGLLTMLAPRHPERGAEIAERAASGGFAVKLRSRGLRPDAATDLYIVDTVGELGLVYRLAPIVFVGGSLIPHGGQNPIEPAKLGAAVLHGPHVANFAELYAALDDAGGAVEVRDAGSLAERIGGWLADDAERAHVAAAATATLRRLGGALERTLAELDPDLRRLRPTSGHA